MHPLLQVMRRVLPVALVREVSIGIYTGASPLALAAPEGISNPVITRLDVTDMLASFVADPFMIRVDGLWHLFFEAVRVSGLRAGERKGEIAVATSRDGLRWQYQRSVLAEPFHLSYPYVFEWNSEHYMIPESYQAGAVRLYRAEAFPFRWVFVSNLLEGPVFLDSSVFRRDGRWWMLTETSPERRNDTLRLFHADDLPRPLERAPLQSRHPGRPAGRPTGGPGALHAEPAPPVRAGLQRRLRGERAGLRDHPPHTPRLPGGRVWWSPRAVGQRARVEPVRHAPPRPPPARGWAVDRLHGRMDHRQGSTAARRLAERSPWVTAPRGRPSARGHGRPSGSRRTSAGPCWAPRQTRRAPGSSS